MVVLIKKTFSKLYLLQNLNQEPQSVRNTSTSDILSTLNFSTLFGGKNQNWGIF